MRALVAALTMLAGIAPCAADPALDALVAAYPDHIAGYDKNELILKDGTRIPIDDGVRGKGFERMLDDPDIKDQFAIPYPLGIAGVMPPAVNEDPGRIRNQPLFVKMYGDCRNGEVKARMKAVPWLPGRGGVGGENDSGFPPGGSTGTGGVPVDDGAAEDAACAPPEPVRDYVFTGVGTEVSVRRGGGTGVIRGGAGGDEHPTTRADPTRIHRRAALHTICALRPSWHIARCRPDHFSNGRIAVVVHRTSLTPLLLSLSRQDDPQPRPASYKTPPSSSREPG